MKEPGRSVRTLRLFAFTLPHEVAGGWSARLNGERTNHERETLPNLCHSPVGKFICHPYWCSVAFDTLRFVATIWTGADKRWTASVNLM